MTRRRACSSLLMAAATCTALAACGLNVASADLFVITRTGQGQTLTLLVNDSGTIRCNGGKAKPISDATLIQARDLSDNLASAAGAKLTIPAAPGQVYYYRVRLSAGTVAFPDRAAGRRKVLGQTELFAAQAAQDDCGLAG